jgi:UDP-glucose 4-epimerase
VREIARIIAEAMGISKPPTFEPERAGDVKHSLASTEAVEAALGFRAEISLEEGLRRTRPGAPAQD